jgi:hypothetical protein
MLSITKIHGRPSDSKDAIPSSAALDAKRVYQILFLTNGKRQRVFVDEADELDFQVLKEHLRCGESVFITSRKEQKLKTSKRMLMQTRMGTRRFSIY